MRYTLVEVGDSTRRASPDGRPVSAIPGSAGARLWATLLAVAGALFALHPVHESDPFWHLAQGRAALASGSRVVPEPMAFLEFGADAVVPEWLWSVGTYLAWQVGGWPILVLLTSAVAAATALALVGLARQGEPGRPHPAMAAVALVTALALGLAMARLRVRPQAMFMLLLPLFIALARQWRTAHGQQRWVVGACLIAVQLLWVQVHGSFVLGPVVFALQGIPLRLDLRERTPDLLVLAALVGALATSAYGLHLPAYILDHAGGYAAGHVADMQPPTWASFDPSRSPYGAGYVALWGIALGGMVAARRLWTRDLLLALFGVLLFATAVRFVSAAAILAVPLAVQGGTALHTSLARQRATTVIAVLLAALFLVSVGRATDRRRGPLLAWGLAEGYHPEAAAAWLGTQRPDLRVVASMPAGAQIGFWLDGRARVLLDTRVPLHYGDAEYLVARSLLERAEAFPRALDRFDPDALVLERHSTACDAVPAGWVPVVIEAKHTTFVPGGQGLPLYGLEPCGTDYIAPGFCADGVGEAEIGRLAELGESPFLTWLRAEHEVRCDGDPQQALALVPPARASRSFAGAARRTRARALVAGGRPREAVDLLTPAVREGSLADVAVAGPVLLGDDWPRDEARALLEQAVTSLDDAAPSTLRADLAWLCTELGDAECAHVHGFGAAALGDRAAAEPLLWLARHHPDPLVREQAVAWLGVLDREAQGP